MNKLINKEQGIRNFNAIKIEDKKVIINNALEECLRILKMPC